jgi:cell division protein FtsQ
MRTVALVGLTGYAAWRGVQLVATAPALQVSRVTVTGNERLSVGEVQALLEGLRGRNIVGLRLGEWQERLLGSPWVEQATLRRVLPATVEVSVRERRPIAIGRIGNGLFLVDASGVVVDEYGPAYADIDLPIVDGLVAKKGADDVDESRAALTARLIAALAERPDLAKRVSQIDVSDSRDAIVMLEGDTTLLRLGDSEFAERLQQYIDLGDALRERVTAIDYVDLRFQERVYVKPVKGAAGKPAPAAGRR